VKIAIVVSADTGEIIPSSAIGICYGGP